MHEEKSTLRQRMRDRLGTLSANERQIASKTLASRIVETAAWKKAGRIGLFAGRNDEMDTDMLWAWRGEKSFSYPKMEGDDLYFYKVTSPDLLAMGTARVREPLASDPAQPDLVLVPGLAFDAHGGRLGRGRGFYDRWLARNPATATLGVGFDFQILEDVPLEAHDVRLHEVISETFHHFARS